MSLTSYRAAPPRATNAAAMAVSDNVNGFVSILSMHRPQSLATTYSSNA